MRFMGNLQSMGTDWCSGRSARCRAIGQCESDARRGTHASLKKMKTPTPPKNMGRKAHPSEWEKCNTPPLATNERTKRGLGRISSIRPND